jgi:phosphopantothenoylcysteine decarboxylase/phosphopantothenate--cysteine ligase
MDYQMVQNPIYCANCEKLAKYGYRILPTETGDLASGLKGPGRLADPDSIIDNVCLALHESKSLSGKRILVTAGPTIEAIDPVRYITNRSSGKMGYSIAREAKLRGAEVTLISGPVSQHVFDGIHFLPVKTAREMSDATLSEWKTHDILIMAAAVADYTPKTFSLHKVKKEKSQWSLDLQKTDDILLQVASSRKEGIVVGFALETEKGEIQASKKVKEKKLDLICLNNPLEEGCGFGEESNKVTLIYPDGKKEPLPLMLKWEVAQTIFDRIEVLMKI